MTETGALTHEFTRVLVIQATRETVFRFFTDEARWATWWGPGSTIDPRPGGRVVIRYPNAVEAWGEVIEVTAPERITFTYGYASGTPIPAGGSRVTIRLDAEGTRTRLHLTHQFADAVANEVHAHADRSVDAWFEAWSEPDPAAREGTLSRVANRDVGFHDRFSAIEGLDDLSVHLTAAQRFMPGIRLRRTGDVRHCQGVVLAEWVAHGSDGQERSRGTNVFVFSSTGLIESVTGFWSQHPQH
jgi:uncharacterized protein YndB with AHSA1/START domain